MKHLLLAIFAVLGFSTWASAQPQGPMGMPMRPPVRGIPIQRFCGGIQGLTCGRGSYCQLQPGVCNRPDARGVCRPLPRVCNRIFAPVCGCNGQTYPNACEAAANGVSVSHNGRCLQRPPGIYPPGRGPIGPGGVPGVVVRPGGPGLPGVPVMRPGDPGFTRGVPVDRQQVEPRRQ